MKKFKSTRFVRMRMAAPSRANAELGWREGMEQAGHMSRAELRYYRANPQWKITSVYNP